jgi:hypothetical protein
MIFNLSARMCTEFAFTDFLLVPRDGSLVDGDGEIDDIVIEGNFAVNIHWFM